LDVIAKLNSPPVCVLASSAAIYAPSIRPHRESDPVGPIDIYGLSKVWAEEAARFYAERRNLRITVARLFNVYGPGETNPHLVPALVSQALANNVVQLGDLSTERDFVHVEDVVRALVSMPGVAVRDRITLMNIGTGRATSGQAVVNAVRSCLDHDIEIALDQSRVRNVDRPSLISDPTSAEQILNWRASIPFEEGIRELIKASVAAGALV
jgi:UDP-glucose 4-epimerase